MGTKNGSGIPNAAFVLDDDDISCKGPTLPAVQQQHKKTTSAITSISPDVFNSVEVKKWILQRRTFMFDWRSVVFLKKQQMNETDEGQQRDTWGNPVEFLMSCISLSVGLGNIWRFPFTAVRWSYVTQTYFSYYL